MKFFKYSLSVFTLVSGLFFLTLITSLTANASMVDEQIARTSVQNYITAIENQDVNEIVKWVKDTRFNSLEQQKKQYLEMFQNNPFTGARIAQLNKVDDNKVNVTIELIRSESQQIEQIKLPVVKDTDNHWRLLVDGNSETRDQNSILIDAASSSPKNDQSDIKSASSSIAYYEFHLDRVGCPGPVPCKTSSYSNSSFDMNSSSVAISGWQDVGGSKYKDVTVVYQIVNKGWFSDDVKGEKIIPKTYFKDNDWYYEKISTLLKQSGVYIKVINPSSEYAPRGAGNVYQ